MSSLLVPTGIFTPSSAHIFLSCVSVFVESSVMFTRQAQLGTAFLLIGGRPYSFFFAVTKTMVGSGKKENVEP